MHVVGLFIGADAHGERADDLRALTYAGSDAEAMHATFADLNAAEKAPWVEDDLCLLLGANATRAEVRAACTSLVSRSASAEIALAVIHVSGHGFPDGTLVLYDTDTSDPAGTGLPVTELVDWVQELRAERVVVILDVCFSGACAGVRHAASDVSIRSKLSAAARGSVVLVWAATESEQAHELSALGHGVLTFGLLAGLDGTTLARRGAVPLVQWLEHAMDKARGVLEERGLVQTPGYALERHDAFSFPSHPVGPHRDRLLARRARHAVTSDPSSLQVYGLTPALTAAISRQIRGEHLTPMQVRAVERAGVMAGQNVLVAAPTASGKTLIGELSVLAALARRQKAVVLLPTRALTEEKFTEFRAAYGEALGATIVRSYGGVDDDDAVLACHQFAVAFLTYEKFLAMILSRPSLLGALGTVVVDEVHLISDGARGWHLEAILTLLRQRQLSGSRLQIVALSAGLDRLNDFDSWLAAELVTESVRRVPLREGVLQPNGAFRYVDERTGEEREVQWVPALAAARGKEYPEERRRRLATHLASHVLRRDTERVLAFCASKPGTRTMASHLGTLGLPAPRSVQVALTSSSSARDDSRATGVLHECLEQGAAFHISDLDVSERHALEAGFRSGELRALAATSGLAMGVNTPATTVLLVDHDRYRGRQQPREPYSVAEYKNMAGRAGRWLSSPTSHGTAVLIAQNETEAEYLFTHYVRGRPEPLESQAGRLAMEDVLLTLLGVVSTGVRVREADLRQLLDATFFAYMERGDARARDLARGRLNTALVTLTGEGFVIRDQETGTIALTALGRVCGREGLTFASAQRVLHSVTWEETGVGGTDDASAGPASPQATAPWANEMTLVVLAQLTDEVSAVHITASPSEYASWEEPVARLITRELLDLLVTVDADASCGRLKRTFGVVQWVKGAPMKQIEAALTRFQKDRNELMAGTVRRVADRTADVIRAVAGVLAACYPSQQHALRDAVQRVRPRLEAGVGRDGAPLLRLRLPLTRKQRLDLIEADLSTLDALEAASIAAAKREPAGAALRSIVGDAGLERFADAVAVAKRRSARRVAAEDRVQHDLFASIVEGAPL